MANAILTPVMTMPVLLLLSYAGILMGAEGRDQLPKPQFITTLKRPPLPPLPRPPAGLSESEALMYQNQHRRVSNGSLQALLEVQSNPDDDDNLIHFMKLKAYHYAEYAGPIGVGTTYTPEGCQGTIVEAHGPASAAASMEEWHFGSKEIPHHDGKCTEVPQAVLNVLFDTGSTNLWMASTFCKTGACVEPGRTRFNPNASWTYICPDDLSELDIRFGTAELRGPIGVDDLKIGPFKVKHQEFGMIRKELGSTFKRLPLEGIVGLGFPSMAAHGHRPFFDSVIAQKLLKHNIFSFYLSDAFQPTGGGTSSLETGSDRDVGSNAILWGGTDRTLYEGDLTWFKVTKAHYWAVDLFQVRLGDKILSLDGESMYPMTHECDAEDLDAPCHRIKAKGPRGERLQTKTTQDSNETIGSHKDDEEATMKASDEATSDASRDEDEKDPAELLEKAKQRRISDQKKKPYHQVGIPKFGRRRSRNKPDDHNQEVKTKMIFDTGTTYYTAYGAMYTEFLESLKPGKCRDTDKYSHIVYVIKDQKGKMVEISLAPKDYMITYDGMNCHLGFMKANFGGEYGPAVMMGELFMRKYFIAFDRGWDGGSESGRIGLARMNPFIDVAKLASSLNEETESAELQKKNESRETAQPIRKHLGDDDVAASIGSTGGSTFTSKVDGSLFRREDVRA